MHPILGNRRRLAIYVLAWLPVSLLILVGLRRDAPWLAAAVFLLPLVFAYAFVALSSWYVCRAFPIRSGSAVWNVVFVQVLAAAFASTLWVGAAGVWANAIDRAIDGGNAEALYLEQQPILWVVGALIFSLVAVSNYLIMAFEASREAETRALESNLLAREAELQAIRAQIDPHFIFNSLHSVSALTTVDPTAARRMCLLLADFLRDTLRLGSHAQISLGEELAVVERFLAIEQVRLGGRLHVDCTAEPDALSCPVPPLLLQPLVENAVVHGVSQLVEGGTIRVTARRVGQVLSVTIENPCDPDRARTRGVGLGLQILRQRLTAQYGVTDAVQTAERNGWFRVDIRVPVTAEAVEKVS